MKEKISLEKQNRKDLLAELLRTNFKLRYNNSVLGFTWVILKPLLNFSVLYLVFSQFKGISGGENYAIYLLLGVVFFTYFNEGIMFGMNSLIGIAHIILKVNFPRIIALQSGLIMALINAMINMLIIAVFAVFNPVNVTLISFLYMVMLLVLLTWIIYTVSLFSSIWIAKFRDLEHITTAFMQLFFYLIPIIYPIEMLPQRFQSLAMLNPIAVIIVASREAFINGQIVYLERILVMTLATFILSIVGYRYFNKNVKKITELF